MGKIKDGIYYAEKLTQLGILDESDWKTPKILSSRHRSRVVKKAIKNGIELTKTLWKNRKK